jgi:hypothetical protein
MGVLSLWAVVMAVIIGGEPGTEPAALAQEKSPQELQFERFEQAERVMNLTCNDSACHNLRPIQTSAKDLAGWTATVTDMVERGAKVESADVPLLTEYLTWYHGPLPEGEGREIMLDICTRCHTLQRIRTHGASAAEWYETLNAMIAEGAPLYDDDIPPLLRYLATNFPPH